MHNRTAPPAAQSYNYYAMLILLMLFAMFLPLVLIYLRSFEPHPNVIADDETPDPEVINTAISCPTAEILLKNFYSLLATIQVPIAIINDARPGSIFHLITTLFKSGRATPESQQATSALQALGERAANIGSDALTNYLRQCELSRNLAKAGATFFIDPKFAQFIPDLKAMLRICKLDDLFSVLITGQGLKAKHYITIANVIKTLAAQQYVIYLHQALQGSVSPQHTEPYHSALSYVRTETRLIPPAIPNAYGMCATVSSHSLSLVWSEMVKYSLNCPNINELHVFMVQTIGHELGHEFVVIGKPILQDYLKATAENMHGIRLSGNLTLADFLRKLRKLDATARIIDIWLGAISDAQRKHVASNPFVYTPDEYFTKHQASGRTARANLMTDTTVTQVIHMVTQLPELHQLPRDINVNLTRAWGKGLRDLQQIGANYVE